MEAKTAQTKPASALADGPFCLSAVAGVSGRAHQAAPKTLDIECDRRCRRLWPPMVKPPSLTVTVHRCLCMPHQRQTGSQHLDPGRTRACNLWFRRPTPYPLGHRTTCNPHTFGCLVSHVRFCTHRPGPSLAPRASAEAKPVVSATTAVRACANEGSTVADLSSRPQRGTESKCLC